MIISPVSSTLAANYSRPAQPPEAVSDSSAAANRTSAAPGSSVATADFSSMTRKEMFDWMNSQIRSGAMSFDESTSFVSMSMSSPVGSDQLVSSDFETKKINFYDLLQQGIAGAQSRQDSSGKARLQNALELMRRSQGRVTGVDISV